MKRFLLLMALWTGLVSSQSVFARGVITVYDARRVLKTAGLSDSENGVVKEKVWPAARKQWSEQQVDRNCEAGTGPVVIDVARGSFTKPHSDQKAILYRYCQTGRNISLNGIAVVENGSVVSHLIYEGDRENGVGALPDITGHGLSELLLSSGGTDQGITWGAIRIIELSDTIVLMKFGRTKTLLDECGADEKNGKVTACRISVKAGPIPDFHRQLYVAEGACGESGAWKKEGKLERFSLENDRTDYQFVR